MKSIKFLLSATFDCDDYYFSNNDCQITGTKERRDHHDQNFSSLQYVQRKD